MSLTSVREIAAIHEITDPWLRITSYKTACDSGGMYPEGPYTFEAEVKVAPDARLGAEFGSAVAARAVRSHFMDRAEDAMDAMEAAGWKLAANWTIEMTTRVTRRPGLPPVQSHIEATVRFAVDRDRTEEETAMHPGVVAARLLGY